MKRLTRTGMALLVAALVSAPSGAEDSTRFESNGFLESLDLFMAEHMAWLKPVPRDGSAEGLKELELSLRQNDNGQQKGFFYLQENAAPIGSGRTSSDIPDFSSLLAPSGTQGVNRLPLAGADSNLTLSFGKDKADPAFRLGFSGSYRIEGDRRVAATDAFGFGVSPGEERIESGLSLGFGGFAIDAAMLQVTDHAAGRSTGYDVGFSWRQGAFATRLSLSEYKAGADLMGIDNAARDVLAVELGASYRLTERIGVQGGVRYLDYSSRIVATPFSAESEQMVFLGGQFRF
ncbi:porin [Gimibacter soli]|uniref:Porin n=1 Tax=Gimibacter soli TaxID=3024400 RepID=A0AAE9XR02_9PROT|nr:porin [Gimibacter soli]WCL54622.1 porin [Gimibacter soli]